MYFGNKSFSLVNVVVSNGFCWLLIYLPVTTLFSQFCRHKWFPTHYVGAGVFEQSKNWLVTSAMKNQFMGFILSGLPHAVRSQYGEGQACMLRIWIYISEYISCWMLEVWAALKAPTSNLNTANRRSAQLWIIVSWNFSVGHHHHLDNPHHHHDTQIFLYQGVNWPTDRAILGVWYSVYLCLSRRQIYLGTLHRHITFCVWEWEQPSQHCFSSCNTQTHLIIIKGRVRLKMLIYTM